MFLRNEHGKTSRNQNHGCLNLQIAPGLVATASPLTNKSMDGPTPSQGKQKIASYSKALVGGDSFAGGASSGNEIAFTRGSPKSAGTPDLLPGPCLFVSLRGTGPGKLRIRTIAGKDLPGRSMRYGKAC